MKKLKLILVFICSFVATGFAQKDSAFRFIKTIKGNFTSFTVDNLDNIFLITSSNQLKKLRSNGDSGGIYNDVKRYGNPTLIDVSNPLKILIYYRNYSTVVVLDRFLNMRNTIDFRKQNIFSVTAIATAYDNNIWLFDEQDYKLKKIDEEGKQQLETVDIRFLLNEAISPTQLIDRDNYIYLYDAEKGFYIFDYYGAYKNKLTFTGWSNTEVNGTTLYGFKENKLEMYQLNSLSLKEYPLPAFFGNYLSIKVMNGKLYLLKKDGIDIYEVN